MKKIFKKIKTFFKKLFKHEHDSSNENVNPVPVNTEIFKSYDSYRTIKTGSTQAWYGRANYWSTSKDILKKELDAFVQHGVNGYLIELAGWANSTGKMWTDSWLKDIESNYNWLLSECRKRNIWLFVSIVNDNMGKNKYGDKGPTLDKVYAYAQKLAKIVKNAGSAGVYVQPVAETQTESGKKFEKYCISELKGFQLVYNGNGGHPTSTISGMQKYAVHPGKISESVPSNAFVVSDHGNIIREMNQGGSISGHGDVNKVKTWAKNVKAKKSPVCAYYAFQVKDFDNDTIKAIGNTLKA